MQGSPCQVVTSQGPKHEVPVPLLKQNSQESPRNPMSSDARQNRILLAPRRCSAGPVAAWTMEAAEGDRIGFRNLAQTLYMTLNLHPVISGLEFRIKYLSSVNPIPEGFGFPTCASRLPALCYRETTFEFLHSASTTKRSTPGSFPASYRHNAAPMLPKPYDSITVLVFLKNKDGKGSQLP